MNACGSAYVAGLARKFARRRNRTGKIGMPGTHARGKSKGCTKDPDRDGRGANDLLGNLMIGDARRRRKRSGCYIRVR